MRNFGWVIVLLAVLFWPPAHHTRLPMMRGKPPFNFGVVEEGRIYRSSQPNPDFLKQVIAERGIRTILKLNPPRGEFERKISQAYGVKLINIPLEVRNISYTWAERAAAILADPKNQPILVHCSAGKDRTGLAVALYRLTAQHWDLKKIFVEMMTYGFRPSRNPKMVRYLLHEMGEVRAGTEEMLSVTADERDDEKELWETPEERPVLELIPIIIKIGPFHFRWYGLMSALAVLVGIWLVRQEVKRKGYPVNVNEIMEFALTVILAGIAGGRAYYVLFNWDFYSLDPGEILRIWHGGLAIHGGLIGGLLAGWFYLRRHHVPTWGFADAVAPAVMLGQVFCRFGNFMNGEAYGFPTSMPWGVVFPPESIAGRQFPGTPIHPVMLYELGLNLLWFIILRHLRLRRHKEGFIFCLYFVLYSTGPLALSGFRADSLWLGPIREGYVAGAVFIIVFGGILLKWRLWEAPKEAARRLIGAMAPGAV